jgi:hypothetical protein
VVTLNCETENTRFGGLTSRSLLREMYEEDLHQDAVQAMCDAWQVTIIDLSGAATTSSGQCSANSPVSRIADSAPLRANTKVAPLLVSSRQAVLTNTRGQGACWSAQ